jgi:hypothetical protein
MSELASPLSASYEPPQVLEDLPLEAFSLTCTKSSGQCVDPTAGGEITT